MKILAVCTGNTCRSPMAAALLKEKGFDAASAGIFANVGAPASPNAVAVMKELGIDISNHRASQLDTQLLEHADVIFAMSPQHGAACVSICPDCKDKITVLNVSDPYGGDEETYRRCRDELAEKISDWAETQC